MTSRSSLHTGTLPVRLPIGRSAHLHEGMLRTEVAFRRAAGNQDTVVRSVELAGAGLIGSNFLGNRCAREERDEQKSYETRNHEVYLRLRTAVEPTTWCHVISYFYYIFV